MIGFAAGFVALGISRLNVPASIRSVMPVVVTPLVSTLLISFLTVVVLGKPLAALMDALTNGLNALSGAGIIVLGVILGLMQASDMGGPINKVAYTFATTGLVAVGTSAAADAPQLKIMAAVMAAGMTPPLGLALATVLRKKLFSEAERHNGKAAWVLGASFITEGAIPFAAVDPLRVIPSCMLGSGVAGGLVMAFGSTLRAPHGGIWVIPLIGNPFLYLIAIAAGALTTCISVIVLKSWNRTPKTAAVSASGEPAPVAA